MTHPAIKEAGIRHQLADREAEAYLRATAGSDPAAARAVKEIDAAREAERKARAEDNRRQAAKLGMGVAQAHEVAAKLAGDRELWGWLQGRVHLSLLKDRPLGEGE